MAGPTSTQENIPNLYITVTGTDIDAGNNDYIIPQNWVNNDRGISIITGTLTNMTCTISASNNGTDFVDVTTALIGAASFASTSAYNIDVTLAYKILRIRVARTNATNAVAFTVFAPKR